MKIYGWNRFCIPGAFILLTMLACNLGSSRTGSQDGPIKAKSFSIDATGGNIEMGDLKVTINQNNLQSPVSITIEEYQSAETEDPGVTAQSNTYHLKGLPPDFNGELQVTFSIPKRVLDSLDASDPDRAQKIVLMLGEDGYSRTGGGVTSGSAPFLDTQVDLGSGQVTALIDLSNEAASLRAGKTAAPVKKTPGHNEWWETTPKHLYFKVVAGVWWNSTQNGDFTVYFPRGMSAGPLVNALMDSRNILETQLGLTVTEPLGVYIEDPGDNQIGVFTWGVLRGYHIKIHPKLLAAGSEQTLKATVGHELMHFAQLLTYQDKGDLDSYASLDEATANWFESELFNDPAYFPDLADEHIQTALAKPWFSGDARSMGRAGYGASWYVHYLVNQYGTDFITQAYNGGHTGGRASWVLGLLDAEGVNNDQAYQNFLAAYISQPEKVSPALYKTGHYGDAFERIVILERPASAQMVFTSFRNIISGDEGTQFAASPGTIYGESFIEYTIDPKPEFSVSRTLNPWNGYYVFLKVNPNFLPYEPVDLSVQVNSSGQYSGVMVYGIPNGGKFSDAQPIHGPENHLSSAGTSTAIIGSISPVKAQGGEGTYSELVFILFNSGEEAASVDVHVTFGEKQPMNFYGEAQATYWAHPDNLCNISCCVLTNPPQCVTSGGGGGGGGGDGDSSSCNQPCPEIPEWCYGCSENHACANLLSIGRGYETSVSIVIDADGNITDIAAPFYGDLGAPTITIVDSSFGSFRAEWSDGEVQISMSGNLNASGGSGIWSVSCRLGSMVSGVWSVAP